jgi:hypothetical protein
LVPGKPSHLEDLRTELDNQRLDHNGAENDGNEELVRKEAVEAIQLVVDTSAVDFVEDLCGSVSCTHGQETYLHHHERVEHHREVLCFGTMNCSSIGNVQDRIESEDNHQKYSYLVNRVPF